eukprot:g26112.t1
MNECISISFVGIVAPPEDPNICIPIQPLVLPYFRLVIQLLIPTTLLYLFVLAVWSLPSWSSPMYRAVVRRNFYATITEQVSSHTLTGFMVARHAIGLPVGTLITVAEVTVWVSCLAVWFCVGDSEHAQSDNRRVAPLDHELDASVADMSAANTDMASFGELASPSPILSSQSPHEAVPAAPRWALQEALPTPRWALQEALPTPRWALQEALPTPRWALQEALPTLEQAKPATQVHISPRPRTPGEQKSSERKISERRITASPSASSSMIGPWGWIVKLRVWGLTRVSEENETAEQDLGSYMTAPSMLYIVGEENMSTADPGDLVDSPTKSPLSMPRLLPDEKASPSSASRGDSTEPRADGGTRNQFGSALRRSAFALPHTLVPLKRVLVSVAMRERMAAGKTWKDSAQDIQVLRVESRDELKHLHRSSQIKLAMRRKRKVDESLKERMRAQKRRDAREEASEGSIWRRTRETEAREEASEGSIWRRTRESY